MTKSEANVRMKEILGTFKGISYQGTRQQTSPALRAQAGLRLTQLQARKRKLEEEIALVSRSARAYRHQLFEHEGLFQVAIAKGDSWEEVLEQLKAYKDARVNRSPLAAVASTQGRGGEMMGRGGREKVL